MADFDLVRRDGERIILAYEILALVKGAGLMCDQISESITSTPALVAEDARLLLVMAQDKIGRFNDMFAASISAAGAVQNGDGGATSKRDDLDDRQSLLLDEIETLIAAGRMHHDGALESDGERAATHAAHGFRLMGIAGGRLQELRAVIADIQRLEPFEVPA